MQRNAMHTYSTTVRKKETHKRIKTLTCTSQPDRQNQKPKPPCFYANRKKKRRRQRVYIANEGIFNHVLMNAATLSTQITPSISVRLPLHLLLSSPPLIISIVYIVCRYFPEVRASKNIRPPR